MKRPVQLRVDEEILEGLEGLNLSLLFRTLASLYLGQPRSMERQDDDVSGIILDGFDAQTHLYEEKLRRHEELSIAEIEEVRRLKEQSLSLVHPKISVARSLDLFKGQSLIGRLELLLFEDETRRSHS